MVAPWKTGRLENKQRARPRLSQDGRDPGLGELSPPRRHRQPLRRGERLRFPLDARVRQYIQYIYILRLSFPVPERLVLISLTEDPFNVYINRPRFTGAFYTRWESLISLVAVVLEQLQCSRLIFKRYWTCRGLLIGICNERCCCKSFTGKTEGSEKCEGKRGLLIILRTQGENENSKDSAYIYVQDVSFASMICP